MSRQRPKPPRSAGADLLPARLCLELPGRAEKPVHVILGVSAEDNAAIAATLVGEWLANQFGQAFTEDRDGEASLGVEAFYDALNTQVGDGAFVAAIGLAENSAPPAASRSATSRLHRERLEFADAGDPITLHFQGIARALFNRASGRAVVMFDHLPGAIELVSEPAPALSPDAEAAHAEATAWYGFGTVPRRNSGIRRGLRSGISHGVVEGELKSVVAEYV
jgi:hypothetical protein